MLKEQVKGFEDLKEVPMSKNLCSYSGTYFSFCEHLKLRSESRILEEDCSFDNEEISKTDQLKKAKERDRR